MSFQKNRLIKKNTKYSVLGWVDRNARSNTYKSTALSSVVGFIDPNPKSMTTRFEFNSFTMRFEVVKSPKINQKTD